MLNWTWFKNTYWRHALYHFYWWNWLLPSVRTESLRTLSRQVLSCQVESFSKGLKPESYDSFPCLNCSSNNLELPYDPAIPLLSIDPKELKSRASSICNLHSSIIHNSQKVETTQAAIKKWMENKCGFICTMRYSSAFKIKEGNFDTCYNMDESWRHYAKWSKPDKDMQNSTYMKYLEQSNL